jgi:hypothetical protein
MKAHGLVPLVTLNHYTLPSWLHDAAGCHRDLDKCTLRGWLDPRMNEPFTAVVLAGCEEPRIFVPVVIFSLDGLGPRSNRRERGSEKTRRQSACTVPSRARTRGREPEGNPIWIARPRAFAALTRGLENAC